MAGGLGKRMMSAKPKVLHEINNIPMIVKILQTANLLNPKKILVVVGKYRDIIETTIKKYIGVDNITFINQYNSMGTGHAIMCCKTTLLNYNPDTTILILSGDVPLISKDILMNTISNIDKDNICKILVTKIEDPTGLGRIIMSNNQFHAIIEDKDCNIEQLAIKLTNAGIYGFTNNILCKYLPYITNNNSQNEYYLTDIIKIIKENENSNIHIYEIEKNEQYMIFGVNTKEQLAELHKYL